MTCLGGQGHELSRNAPHPQAVLCWESQLGVDKLMPISWQLFSCLSLCRRCQSQQEVSIPCSLPRTPAFPTKHGDKSSSVFHTSLP